MGATMSGWWYGTGATSAENSPLAVTNSIDITKNGSELVTGTSNDSNQNNQNNQNDVLVTGTTQ